MDAEQRASTETPLHEWLDRLAQKDGAPGGGSASGVLLAVGAALLQMVLSYSDPDDASGLRDRAERLRIQSLDDELADARASAALGAALRRDADDPDREAAIVRAGDAAARTSAKLGATGIDGVRLLEETAGRAIPAVVADLGVAAEALAAGLGGALINLRADLDLIRRHDAADLTDIAAEADRMETARQAASKQAQRVREG